MSKTSARSSSAKLSRLHAQSGHMSFGRGQCLMEKIHATYGALGEKPKKVSSVQAKNANTPSNNTF